MSQTTEPETTFCAANAQARSVRIGEYVVHSNSTTSNTPINNQQQQQKRPVPPTKSKTLADLLVDESLREAMAFLIAKLESTLETTRKSVFRTEWTRKLFSKSLQNLTNESKIVHQFDLDVWYNSMKQKYIAKLGAMQNLFEGRTAEIMNPDITTDWATPLLTIEGNIPGFMKLLHSCLLLEEKAHVNMAGMADETNKYGSYNLIRPAIGFH